MKLLQKVLNYHMENLRPGSNVPHTQDFKDGWEARVSYEAGFYEAKTLARERLLKLSRASHMSIYNRNLLIALADDFGKLGEENCE